MRKISFLLLLSFFVAFSCTKEIEEVPVQEVSFNVVGMYCDGCVKAIGDRMKKIDGATDVKVTLRDSLVVFNIPQNKVPTSEELSAMLVELGYEMVLETESND
jgi:copper chaperone CopZ